MLDFKKHFEEGMRKLEYRRSSLNLPVHTIQINVRSIEDISSMTLFDASDTITRLKRGNISNYHRKLTRRLQRDGFLREDLTKPIVGEFHHWYFHVKELVIAPIATMDRIDAILEPSPHWKYLHRDLQGLAEATPGLHRTVSPADCERWLPSLTLAHITNGIEGCTMAEQFLKKLIKVLAYPLYKEVISSKRQNVSIGGDKPIYTNLKWNFTFRERPLVHFRPQEIYSIDYPMLRNPLEDDYGYEDGDEILVDDMGSDSKMEAQSDDFIIYDPMDHYVVPLEDLDLEPVEDEESLLDELPFVETWEEEEKDPYSKDKRKKQSSEVQNQEEEDRSLDELDSEVHDIHKPLLHDPLAQDDNTVAVDDDGGNERLDTDSRREKGNWLTS
jgi:hypothetical protein